jgi:hypothetical protein
MAGHPRQRVADPRRTRAFVLALIVAVSAGAGAQGPPPIEDARAALQRVLADPEFAGLHSQSAMQQAWTHIVEWFARILQRLGLGRVAQAATAETVAWVMALVALGALLGWLTRVLRGARARPRLSLRPGDSTMQTLSARAWARRAAAAPDPRETVRCAYRAAMCRLEEEGVWRIDDARTPREYLRLLPDEHRRRRPVVDVARRFEEIWFGAREATDDDRRSLLGRLEELECLPAE